MNRDKLNTIRFFAGILNRAKPRPKVSLIKLAPLVLTFALVIAPLGARAAETDAPDASAAHTDTKFNSAPAFADLEAQCALGPRIPGTDAHRAGRDWIARRLRELGYRVWLQRFQDTNPLTGESVEAWNVWGIPAAWGPDTSGPETESPALAAKPDSFILLSAHWDTRPWADEEPLASKRQPFLGANDGASGVAVALEVARTLKGRGLENRVALVFYDLEDSGIHGKTEGWSRGAQFALAHLPPWFGRLRVGINLDMVAGKELVLRREAYGEKVAPDPSQRL